MGTIDTKQNFGTTKTPQLSDQPEVLTTGEIRQGNKRRFPDKISDSLNAVLGGSPNKAEFLAGSEAKKGLEQLKIYAIHLTIAEKEMAITFLLPLSDQRLSRRRFRQNWKI